MPVRIRQVTIGTVSWAQIIIPVACNHARLVIPDSATSDVDVREDQNDATTQTTLHPGQYYDGGSPLPLRGSTMRYNAGALLCYAKAQSVTVTGERHCLDV